MTAPNRIPRTALRSQLLERFSCLGPQCADNCCNTWTVKVDAPTLALYRAQAPELLHVVTEREGIGAVLQFDADTGLCPQLECGGCHIHATRGTDFLTDTCHLYPRITRALAATTVVTATLSCPEIARLALVEEASLALVKTTVDRVPEQVKNYAAEGVNTEEACALMAAMQANITSAEQHLIALANEALVLSNAPMSQWPMLHQTHTPSFSTPIGHAHDVLFMLIILTTLVTACNAKPSVRLQEVVALIEHALHVDVVWDEATANTQPDTLARLSALQQRYDTHYQAALQPLLNALLKAQLAASLYPYAGLGNNPLERIAWVAYAYALTRFALLCAIDQSGGELPESLGIQVVQTIARVLDHVGSLELALPMLKEIGWLDPARLAGILAPHNM